MLPLPQSRNFALNPNNGIKIPAYKDAGTAQGRADRELHRLSRYLLHIARTNDLQSINHKVSSVLEVNVLTIHSHNTSRIGER
jgi:hypothetical protein